MNYARTKNQKSLYVKEIGFCFLKPYLIVVACAFVQSICFFVVGFPSEGKALVYGFVSLIVGLVLGGIGMFRFLRLRALISLAFETEAEQRFVFADNICSITDSNTNDTVSFRLEDVLHIFYARKTIAVMLQNRRYLFLPRLPKIEMVFRKLPETPYMKRIKKQRIISVVILVLFFAVMFGIFFFGLQKTKDPNAYIFASIIECEMIETKGGTVIPLDASEDKDNKGLEYSAFYGASYQSDALSFELFAYEFETADAAKEYHQRGTGNATPFENGFRKQGTIFSYTVWVYDGNRAYTVKCDNSDAEELDAFLKEILSITIE